MRAGVAGRGAARQRCRGGGRAAGHGCRLRGAATRRRRAETADLEAPHVVDVTVGGPADHTAVAILDTLGVDEERAGQAAARRRAAVPAPALELARKYRVGTPRNLFGQVFGCRFQFSAAIGEAGAGIFAVTAYARRRARPAGRP